MDETVKGLDDISQLQIEFKNDVLYRMLQRAGLEQTIITSEMYEKLKYGLNYRPQDAAFITGVNEGTLRGWLNGKDSSDLPVYINAFKENKFHILDCESVFRVRLIFLVQKELKYSLNHISGIAVGKGINGKVITPNENYMNQLEEIKESNIQLEKQNKMLYSMISVLFEQDTNGEWKIKNQTPLLESNESFKKMQEEIDSLNNQLKLLKEELIEEKQSKLDLKLEVVKTNMMYKQAENMALERRTFFEKFLNKKPDPELINKCYEELKKLGKD